LERGDHYFAHSFREVLEHGPELYYRSLQESLKCVSWSLHYITLSI